MLGSVAGNLTNPHVSKKHHLFIFTGTQVPEETKCNITQNTKILNINTVATSYFTYTQAYCTTISAFIYVFSSNYFPGDTFSWGFSMECHAIDMPLFHIVKFPITSNTNMLVQKQTVAILSSKNCVWSCIYQNPVRMTGEITSIYSPRHALTLWRWQSIVSMCLGYGLKEWRFVVWFLAGRQGFFFYKVCRPPLVPTQPPTEQMLGLFSLG